MASATPNFKVILCGEYGVGKSSLFRRFVDNSFTTDCGPRSTIGLDHMSKAFHIRGRTVKLELWDTAGIERFATLSSSYFQSASAAILCYGLDSRDSFNMLSQHILEIIMHSQTAKIFLCGMKNDVFVDSENQITDLDIADFMQQCDAMLSGTYKVSCLTGDGVREMFEEVAIVLEREATCRFDPSTIRPREAEEAPVTDKKCCR